MLCRPEHGSMCPTNKTLIVDLGITLGPILDARHCSYLAEPDVILAKPGPSIRCAPLKFAACTPASKSPTISGCVDIFHWLVPGPCYLEARPDYKFLCLRLYLRQLLALDGSELGHVDILQPLNSLHQLLWEWWEVITN